MKNNCILCPINIYLPSVLNERMLKCRLMQSKLVFQELLLQFYTVKTDFEMEEENIYISL